MRVALEFPDGSIAAYKLGRIEDGVHNFDLITGEVTPMDEFIQKLIDRAEKEFPDCNVFVQRMVLSEERPEESAWIHHKEFDPDKHQETPAGGTISPVAMSHSLGVSAQAEGER